MVFFPESYISSYSSMQDSHVVEHSKSLFYLGKSNTDSKTINNSKSPGCFLTQPSLTPSQCLTLGPAVVSNLEL
jgi:hypothetical protein